MTLSEDDIRRAYADRRRALETVSPADLAAEGEQRLLAAFRRAARDVPAYAALLRERGVRPDRIGDAEAFREQVPVIDKQWAFGCYPLRDLCAGGTLEAISRVYASSGHSGTFSFGVETAEDHETAAVGLEFLLDTAFGVLDRATFLINGLAMGVRITTRSLPVAETSVRPDVVLALLEELRDDFDQFILIGDYLFLKRVLEEGTSPEPVWGDRTVHLIMGGEFIAETTRTYFAGLLGTDLDRPSGGRVLLNMGLSELGISIFRDGDDLMRIRRAVQADRALRYALFGEGTEVCPEILQYDPREYHVEVLGREDGDPRIAVSTVDPRRVVPLMRYDTRDAGTLIAYDDMVRVLRDHGREDLRPRFRLPVALLSGRRQEVDLGGGRSLSTNDVKEALYADPDVAGQLTGFFHIIQEPGATAVRVQTRPGVEPGRKVGEKLEASLRRCVGADVPVQPVAYRAYPHCFEPDYERKPRYIEPAT